MRLGAVVAALALAVSAGCSGGEDDGREAGRTPSTPPAAGPRAGQQLEDPGRVLERFVAAAAAHSASRMWALLSKPSRARLGRDLGHFRLNAGALERTAGRVGGRGSEVILAERITARWAVAAVGRVRAREFRAYAVALRHEGGRWRVEVDDPLRIRPLVPDPAESLRQPRTQLAAEFKARDPISEAGIWLDGQAVPTTAGGLGPSYFTAYGESGQLGAGLHSVVAFASTGRDARALAWTFETRSSDDA